MFGKMKAGSLAAVASATFLAASGMLCSMNAAYAQYVGPSQVRQYNNVAEILKNPVDDTYVTLKGNITTQLTDKMYRFTDGTGSINAKIGPKEFAGQRIDDKTRVVGNSRYSGRDAGAAGLDEGVLLKGLTGLFRVRLDAAIAQR